MANEKKARQGAAKRSPSWARLSHPVTDDLDRTPVAMPAGFTRPTPLHEIIAKLVREAVEAEKGEDFETMEEADDFEEDPEHAELLDMSNYTFENIQDDYDGASLEEPPETMGESPEKPSEAPQETNGDSPNPDDSEPVKQP